MLDMEDLLRLEEVGLINIEKEGRQFTYDFSIYPNLYIVNNICINEKMFKIKKNKSDGKISAHLEFGIINFTTIGEELCRILKIECIDGLDNLVNYHLDAQGYTLEEIHT